MQLMDTLSPEQLDKVFDVYDIAGETEVLQSANVSLAYILELMTDTVDTISPDGLVLVSELDKLEIEESFELEDYLYERIA